jgi:hypothetical protein
MFNIQENNKNEINSIEKIPFFKKETTNKFQEKTENNIKKSLPEIQHHLGQKPSKRGRKKGSCFTYSRQIVSKPLDKSEENTNTDENLQKEGMTEITAYIYKGENANENINDQLSTTEKKKKPDSLQSFSLNFSQSQNPTGKRKSPYSQSSNLSDEANNTNQCIYF